MTDFQGFDSQENFVPIPESFFLRLLPVWQRPEDLKTALYVLWRLQRRENDLPALDEAALTSPEAQAACGLDAAALQRGLRAAVEAGLLLEAVHQERRVYLLNSPRGRLLLASWQKGDWQPPDRLDDLPPQPRPNLYRLYEEHIGPLSPLIVDALRDAEETYPAAWVAEAIEIAVKRNARNWRYIEAILKRWKEEGHVSQQDRQDHSEADNRYRKGKFADFIES